MSGKARKWVFLLVLLLIGVVIIRVLVAWNIIYHAMDSLSR